MPPHLTSAASYVKSYDTTTNLNTTSKQTGVHFKSNTDTKDDNLAINNTQFKETENPKIILVWKNIFIFTFLHLAAIYGGYLFLTQAKWATVFFSIFLYCISLLGMTAGAHRLWTHRSYKAKWPLRLILIIFNTVALQSDVFEWVRDHLLHHKFCDTNADPYTNSRGFFFSHIGWLLCEKHPEVSAKGKLLDMSDIITDPFVMFQKKHYTILFLLFCFILPTLIPMYFWEESFLSSFFVAAIFRWCASDNAIFSVNSFAHRFGTRSYDKSVNTSENPIVSVFTLGEGWHNYHHVFPWDYKTGEWGNYSLNMTTAFIDFFAKIGWAYDLKSATPETIEKRVKRTGDGTHELWGYASNNIIPKDQDALITLNKKI